MLLTSAYTISMCEILLYRDGKIQALLDQSQHSRCHDPPHTAAINGENRMACSRRAYSYNKVRGSPTEKTAIQSEQVWIFVSRATKYLLAVLADEVTARELILRGLSQTREARHGAPDFHPSTFESGKDRPLYRDSRFTGDKALI